MPRQRTPEVDYETRVGDLLDLRAFALASDARSLAAVARVMGESKATISRRITRLEAALGTALLRRSSRGIETTDAGAAYRERVAEVLELLGDANAAVVHGDRATPAGQLRVSAPPGLGNALAPLFAGFCAQYPRVVLVVHIASRFVDIEAERFDVALRTTAKLADSSLVALEVGDPQPEGIFVAAPSYVSAHPAPRRPSDLASHRIIALGDSGAATSIPLLRRGSTETIELRLPVAIAGSDLGFCKDMALHGAGIAILPRLSVQRELDEGRLIHLLPDHVWPSMRLFLLHRGGRFVSPKLRAFLDYMRQALDLKQRRPPAAGA